MTESPTLSLDLEVKELIAGESIELAADKKERVVVVLSGRISARFPGSSQHWKGLGGRADVFEGPATALYAPRMQPCQIEAEDGGVRLAVVSAVAINDREPYVVLPEDIRIEHRGTGVWKRAVHNIIGPDQASDNILLGETFCSAGVWSGYPPHRHDRHAPPYESRLDEMFLVQVRPQSGFGVLVRYSEIDEREQATVVRDGDILSVTEGYHSFVAAGGHRFYYLWALAGEGRLLLTRTDPRHVWLLEEPPDEVSS